MFDDFAAPFEGIAQALLEQEGLWHPEYHSKTLDEVIGHPFDLAVTVYDNARQTCPIYPEKVKTIHESFEDPSGKEEVEYVKTLRKIEKELFPLFQKKLC